MRARSTILKVFLITILSSLLLQGCYGGDTGRTWFNLPSIAVRVQSNGALSAYGIPIPAVLPQDLLGQFHAANIQQLEVRIGYN
ncbi:MAG: hypothetical protein AAF639_05410, partial [Chloroflexota bacterium]